jgi:hypothetical protein
MPDRHRALIYLLDDGPLQDLEGLAQPGDAPRCQEQQPVRELGRQMVCAVRVAVTMMGSPAVVGLSGVSANAGPAVRLVTAPRYSALLVFDMLNSSLHTPVHTLTKG